MMPEPKILEELVSEIDKHVKRYNLSEFWKMGAYIGTLEGIILRIQYKTEKETVESIVQDITNLYKNNALLTNNNKV